MDFIGEFGVFLGGHWSEGAAAIQAEEEAAKQLNDARFFVEKDEYDLVALRLLGMLPENQKEVSGNAI